MWCYTPQKPRAQVTVRQALQVLVQLIARLGGGAGQGGCRPLVAQQQAAGLGSTLTLDACWGACSLSPPGSPPPPRGTPGHRMTTWQSPAAAAGRLMHGCAHSLNLARCIGATRTGVIAQQGKAAHQQPVAGHGCQCAVAGQLQPLLLRPPPLQLLQPLCPEPSCVGGGEWSCSYIQVVKQVGSCSASAARPRYPTATPPNPHPHHAPSASSSSLVPNSSSSSCRSALPGGGPCRSTPCTTCLRTLVRSAAARRALSFATAACSCRSRWQQAASVGSSALSRSSAARLSSSCDGRVRVCGQAVVRGGEVVVGCGLCGRPQQGWPRQKLCLHIPAALEVQGRPGQAHLGMWLVAALIRHETPQDCRVQMKRVLLIVCSERVLLLFCPPGLYCPCNLSPLPARSPHFPRTQEPPLWRPRCGWAAWPPTRRSG